MKKLVTIFLFCIGCIFLCITGCDLGLLPGEGEMVVLLPAEKEKDKTEEVTEKNKNDEEKENLPEEEKSESEDENKEPEAETETEPESEGEGAGTEEETAVEEVKIEERQWNILVYMGADNNLEASAIEDFSEMELSNLNTDAVSVFVLLDRSASYDTSNGNWSGTRLYKLKTKRTGGARKLISEEIECKPLDLKPGIETELDMSSPFVLSDVLGYIKDRYPANNYGLIMWGHGNGWRSEAEESVKGFAFDDDSKTYMTLRQLNNGIKTGMNGNKLDFLGFDTCFGAELEVLYQLRDSVKYTAGCEGLLMSSGWNYRQIFDLIQESKDKTALNICSIIAKNFADNYEHTPGASIAVIDMSETEKLFTAFDDFMGTTADLINTRKVRDEVMGVLYSNKNCNTQRFTYGAAGSDVYLDIYSSILELQKYFNSPLIDKKTVEFQKAFNQSVLYNWNSNGSQGGIGVYFQTISSSNLLSISHPPAYMQGKTIEQIDFVADSQGYVPGVENKKSLLEKLFYESY